LTIYFSQGSVASDLRGVLRTICGDACPFSCVSAEACLTGWPNARGRRDGES